MEHCTECDRYIEAGMEHAHAPGCSQGPGGVGASPAPDKKVKTTGFRLATDPFMLLYRDGRNDVVPTMKFDPFACSRCSCAWLEATPAEGYLDQRGTCPRCSHKEDQSAWPPQGDE